jgi:GNAT superfamily N-acetyltransferase
MRKWIDLLNENAEVHHKSFKNELGNEIEARVTKYDDGRKEPVKLQLIGPDSESENDITTKEAEVVHALLTNALYPEQLEEEALDFDDSHYRDEHGSPNYETRAHAVIASVKDFAGPLPITVELQPYRNYFTHAVQGVTLTDLYAREPGSGTGSAVMRHMCEIADRAEINLYTDPEGPRSKAFYEKFGFERNRNNSPMLVRYADVPVWDDDEGLMEGSTPTLYPAIRIGRKLFTARDQGATHFDALDLITDPQARGAAMLDGDNRGFVDERGRWKNRAKAAQYARDYQLFDTQHPEYRAWMKDAYELSSETPLR